MDKGQLYILHGVISGGIKAAIWVAKETFPNADVQGCAFHLALAWNRKAGDLGLRQLIKGRRRLGQVPALQSLPVNLGHPVYEPCNKFLTYLRNIWFTGVFQDMWCKWNLQELRITNIAEAFHSKLRSILSRQINPPFEELLECFREQHTLALAKVLHANENNAAAKHLRRRDRLRRYKNNATMEEFRMEL
ncbi:unnamed protein product [Strongylus vulgaris]|uniref:MULE transposase domain-containing protein n=1 Tax=Strongylus vulgaris TaxID=40348 RepID=A0A3P7JDI7_STRVU|nr:unnamed protein product [Strongylus vulgaris]